MEQSRECDLVCLSWGIPVCGTLYSGETNHTLHLRGRGLAGTSGVCNGGCAFTEFCVGLIFYLIPILSLTNISSV